MDSSLFFKSPAKEMSFYSKGMYEKGTDENISVTHIPIKSAMIVLMNHPASITVYKYVSIEVLSGSVSVFGYEITPRSEPMKVFSSEKTGLIEVKTETFERIWKKKECSANLEEHIYSITNSHKTTTDILRKFGNSTVAIFVKCCPYPANVQFLELYYPHALDFSLYSKKAQKELYYVPKAKGVPIQFSLDEERLASEINVLIRSAKLTESDAPRVIVCGPKNTGKTSLLRFLVNKILSVYLVAYYLDTDPGQTEFTPPGVVSLTKVTKPIVGPPFCHQQNPIKMMFTGNVSPTFVEIYSKSISKLIQLYAEKYAYEPLFINTMGWMQGTGLECLISTITAVKPTVLVEIVTEDETSMFDYRHYLPSGSQYFQICSHDRKPHFLSKEIRDLSLLSHLGKCQSEFFGPMLLNEIKPYSVSWDKIPVYIFPGGNVPPSRLIEAISESIVALCTVPESAILESDIPEFPKTLEFEPENECLGYGLVQAVDEKEHLLYIVSPLKANEWIKVNAIIKGKLMVPDAVILKEDIYDVPLPYTDEREVLPQDEEENLDISMVSLKHLSETDSPAANLNAHASVDNYRKKIPKRYRKPFHK